MGAPEAGSEGGASDSADRWQMAPRNSAAARHKVVDKRHYERADGAELEQGVVEIPA